MAESEFLGAPRPLREWLAALDEVPADGWLYIREDETTLSLDTRCWPAAAGYEEQSEEEQEAFEEWLEESGYTEFLNVDDLQQVVEGLRQQRAEPSEPELVAAIAYFYEHDAFIDLSAGDG